MQPVRLTPLRGRILDRLGSPLAISVKSASVYSQRTYRKDPHRVARQIAPYTNKDPQELYEIFSRRNSFTWLARQISLSAGREIQKLGCPGIGIELEGKRYYPKKELAGQIIGFVGIDSQGLEGLELGYEKCIKGNEVTLTLQRDALGRTLWQEVPQKREKEVGKDLILTLDSRIQYYVERCLTEAVQRTGAISGSVVVMDPMSGEILAMASQPLFNPNRFNSSSPFAWKNHPITDSFEPGSTVKAIMLAAALEEGIVEEGHRFFCEYGRYPFGGRTIHDIHKYGELTVRDILVHSSNIGATKIAEVLGARTLCRYLRAFGFGSHTGIDLPGEVTGTLKPFQKWPRVALANHAFGQGFTVTAIQLASAFSALANGGFLMKPYVVKEIRDPCGKEGHVYSPKVVRRVISRQTSLRVMAVLEAVVTEGTGRQAQIPGYRVAGKTGTAQKVDPEGGGYSSDKYTISFIGIVPVDKPEMVVVVILDEPASPGTGGLLAAPVFRQIALNTLRYRNVMPEGSPELLDGDDKREAASQDRGGLENSVNQGKQGERYFPDLYGLSLRKALQLLEGYPVSVEIQGSGRVISQRPSPGTVLHEGDRCVLEASPVTQERKDLSPLT
jgi:cell division protein FtsI (penicillin-binding protein 3)